MNSWQFYQYTQYPDNLNLHDEVQLRGLIKDYPYFQAAHLLLAKCLKNQDNYSFEKQLKLAALYAPNRSLLYSLLKSASKPVMIEEIEFPVAETVAEVPVEQEAEPIEVIEEVIEVVAETVEEISEEKIESIIEAEIVEETIAETETPITAETIDIPAAAETVEPELPEGVIYITETITQEIIEEETIITDTVVEEIVEEDIIITDTITEELIIEEETIVEDKVTEEIVVEDIVTGDIVFEETIIEEIPVETEEEQLVAELTIAEPVAARAFSAWLKQTASSGNSVFLGDITEPTQLKQPENNYIIPTHSSADFSGQSLLTIAKPESVQAPQPSFSDEILEKFISSNPTISRPKTEFYNPSKAAKKSLEPDENLATETLAKIALRQNNYLKAIKIYEKLSLRFPEKFTIFATQIKKIKTENNLE